MGLEGLANPCSLNLMRVILRALQSSLLLARWDVISTLGFSPTNFDDILAGGCESQGRKVKVGLVGKTGDRENS